MLSHAWRRLCTLACLATCLALGPISPVAAQVMVAAAAESSEAAGSRGGAEARRTRFVIALDRKVEYQVFALANPNRVIVELPAVGMQLPTLPEESGPIGLVKAFRAGEAGPGRARVVIDVTQPVVVDASRVEKGAGGKDRLVLEFSPFDGKAKTANKAGAAAPTVTASVQPPLPKPAVSPAKRAAKAFRPILVLDPGHGGHDSGATKNGTVEKEVVLAFALALRDKLNATGRYRVMLTREDDRFVELDERRAFAERHNANLFVAVHADYAQSKARGATIFSLRDTVADSLKRSTKSHVSEHVLSDKEMKTVQETAGDVSAVQGILSELAEREVDATKERTSVLSRSLIEYMGSTTELRDNPDQQAAFRVLKTAQFPSVLIELAYVTNKQDAENLRSNAWRDKVADAIVTAIDTYFNQQVAKLPM